MSDTRRYFALEEAQGLVAWLEETFEALAPLAERASQLRDQIQALLDRMQRNGGGDLDEQLARDRISLQQTTSQIERGLRPVQQRGILVKSVEQGLVDFPSLRDGREVYLCWQMGEQEIGFWHEVDAGFARRQPL